MHEFYPPMVHRDLTPNNIMVAEGMQIKIMDLGLTRTLDYIGQKSKRTFKIIGTPNYMCQE